ncbi:MAG: HEAT repeat domain-containing protein [Candidatus Hodarchaeales archaeon]
MSDPFGLRQNERALTQTWQRLQLRCNFKPSVACADLVKLTPILSLIDSKFDENDLSDGLIQIENLFEFLESLIKGKKTKNGLRKSAIYLTAFIDAESLLPVLEKALQDHHNDTVLETIKSIASIGTPEAFNTLHDFFQNEKDKKRRLEVLRNASNFDLTRVDLFVEKNLRSSDRDTVQAALEGTYGIFYSRSSTRLMKVVEEIVCHLLITGWSTEIRRLALEVLILSKPGNAVDCLLRLLDSHYDSSLLEEVVLALEEFDDQRIPGVLENIAIDPGHSESVRRTAFSLLRQQ